MCFVLTDTNENWKEQSYLALVKYTYLHDLFTEAVMETVILDLDSHS